jgi:histidinol dehydrogenase
MKIFHHNDATFERKWRAFTSRAAAPPKISQTVAKIIADVRKNGNRAVEKYTKKFDRIAISAREFRVSVQELAEVDAKIDAETREAVALAHRNIEYFAAQMRKKNWELQERSGAKVGERFVPLERVGVYVPGGHAPLVSTVLMTVTLAKVAGVREIVVATPPNREKKLHPALLFAAKYAGALEIYKIGGAQAVAALAFGTNSIRPVQKIVGPGNVFVTEAKRQVFGTVSIDMLAGPSEVLIIADDTANPQWLALDLLAQAEHGTGNERAVVVTDSEQIAKNVAGNIQNELKNLPRADAIRKVLRNGAACVLVKSLDEAAEIANDFAPEHLQICTASPRALLEKIRCAGAIFLGQFTPEVVGDYVAGPSHVLPTGGAARNFSGLTVDTFLRRISTVEYSESALREALPMLETFAKIEGLDAHGRSARARFSPEK